MNVLLDTSILIADERGAWDAGRFSREIIGDGRPVISAITASEFLEGIHRAEPGKRRERRQAFFDSFVEVLAVLPFGLEEAHTHALLKSELKRSGTMIGAHDLLIAATCLHHDLEIATLNTGEFSRIPGLLLAPVLPFFLPHPTR